MGRLIYIGDEAKIWLAPVCSCHLRPSFTALEDRPQWFAFVFRQQFTALGLAWQQILAYALASTERLRDVRASGALQPVAFIVFAATVGNLSTTSMYAHSLPRVKCKLIKVIEAWQLARSFHEVMSNNSSISGTTCHSSYCKSAGVGTAIEVTDQ